ncbi:MAG: hypothetical protein JEY99_05230 [Spirochaetales bacterium]|nr:hypothetical protein [Spirochaetales bacterium]
MENFTLAAIKIGNRVKDATGVQEILTAFGCSIKVRLGLHDVPTDVCSASGLIILQLVDTKENIEDFLSKLNALDDVSAKSLVI